MKQICILFIVVLFITGPTVLSFDYNSNIISNALVYAQNMNPDANVGGTQNSVFWTLIFVLGFVVLWFVFYMILYRFLLNYYPPGHSKNLFWSIFLLYSLTWTTIMYYLLVDNFYVQWLKWVLLFLSAIWMIWLVIILFQKKHV